MSLPSQVVDLLREPSTCYLATSMPDGSPQVTQTWVDTDGTHVLINTVQGNQKLRNVMRDPRVSLVVSRPSNPARYVELRGVVIATETQGAREHIEQLSLKYLSKPYNWDFVGRDQVRTLIAIDVRSIAGQA